MLFSSIDSPIRWLFLIHAIAGAVALAVFLIPILSKKGGKLHETVGWIYTACMVLVGLSAMAAITPWRIFLDPERTYRSITFAVFLFYISVFTLSAIAYGLTALKAKKRKAPSPAPQHIVPPVLTLVFGVATQVIGLKFGNTLLLTFPILGHITACQQLKYWRSTPIEKMHWWYAHMNGMIVACIATITAFLVTALPRLVPGTYAQSPLLWIAPGAILGTIGNRWTAAYRTRYEKRP